MSKKMRVCICSIDAVEKNCNARTKYEDLRAAVLKAGRFSCFEATHNSYSAKLYTQLCKDPTLKIETLRFPWTAVSEAHRG